MIALLMDLVLNPSRHHPTVPHALLILNPNGVGGWPYTRAHRVQTGLVPSTYLGLRMDWLDWLHVLVADYVLCLHPLGLSNMLQCLRAGLPTPSSI